ncbi:MAG: LysE family translocator [Pseudomonadota bacterium]
MSPGPSRVFIAWTLPTSVQAAGFANLAGFVADFYFHGAMAVLGLSLILVQSTAAIAIVKYLGAAYICWMGVTGLLSAWYGIQTTGAGKPAKGRRTLLGAHVEGLLTNTLNPKVSMCYLAAQPQSTMQGKTTAPASLLLVFIHSMIKAVWSFAMILQLSHLTAIAQNGSFHRWLIVITCVVFIGYGAQLATYKPDT